MVTIKARDETEDSEGQDWEDTFTVPLGLLTAAAMYIKSMFEGGFVEGKEKKCELRDIYPWIWPVFLASLYRGTIFYDPERATSITTQKKRMLGNAHNPGRDLQEGAAEATSEKASSTIDLTDDDNDPAAGATRTSAFPMSVTILHIPGGCDNKFDRASTFEYTDDTLDHEYKYRQPVTWDFFWLLELYVSADKFDCRDLRMKVFEAIYQNIYQKHPKRYHVTTAFLKKVAEILMPNSPLFRPIADFAAFAQDPVARMEDQIRVYEAMPSAFASRALVAIKRMDRANACKKCQKNETGEECKDESHSKEDTRLPLHRGFRDYHEHGDRLKEKRRCEERWTAVKDTF